MTYIGFSAPNATSSSLLVSLTEIYGSNFGAIFVPDGFVSSSHALLLEGAKVDLGAGGSCAPIYWKRLNVDTKAIADFSTQPIALVYDYHSKIVFANPGPCMSPVTAIQVLNVTTGKTQVIRNFKHNEAYTSFSAVVQKQGQYVLQYTLDQGPVQELILP